MIMVNTDHVPGYRVTEAYGVVRGSTIRAKHIGKDIGAALKLTADDQYKSAYLAGLLRAGIQREERGGAGVERRVPGAARALGRCPSSSGGPSPGPIDVDASCTNDRPHLGNA